MFTQIPGRRLGPNGETVHAEHPTCIAGLLAVLNALLNRAGSTWFCKAAYHVLYELTDSCDSEILKSVFEALEQSEPGVAVPPAAYNALVALKVRTTPPSDVAEQNKESSQ